jgi:hypothetical protein
MLSREEVAARISQLPPEQQPEAASLALEIYGPAPQSDRFIPYRYNPNGYIPKFLKWTPWHGMDAEHPGQAEILDACALVMRQQWEKDLYEKEELTYEGDEAVWLDDEGEERRAPASWRPGQVIRNWIRVESGNGIGKTKSASGILNWFLDCYTPSAIFTFAPGGDQARFAIWSEIRGDREHKGLPGRILEKEIKVSAKHFAAHRTVSEAGGKGEERLKGKHEAFQLFLCDEADGISATVFESITSMTSGGMFLVVMFANPKSRASQFHRCKTYSYVQSFRVSTLYHPNVVAGREIIPGAVRRGFVEKKLETDCDVVSEHNEDEFTFTLPYDVTVAGVLRPAGTIFRPTARFMTDVLGVTPPNNSDRTLIPVGRFEAACEREPEGGDVKRARVGVDAARFGSDSGTIYFNWNGMVWCECELEQMEGPDYVDAIRKGALKLKAEGVTSLHIRVDAGYGAEVIGGLKRDDELIKAFPDYKVYEVHFGGATYSSDYFHLVTEMYAEAAESLKSLAVIDPHDTLEEDLCEREYDWRNKAGKDTKILQDKASFKKKKKRSPDHGDGFVLAVAPDFLFSNKQVKSKPVGLKQKSRWMGKRPGMPSL